MNPTADLIDMLAQLVRSVGIGPVMLFLGLIVAWVAMMVYLGYRYFQ